MRKNNILESMSYLIKPASSSCNLCCPYCFYFDVADSRCIPNFGKMKEETVNALVKGAFEVVTENGYLQFSFQGGEPTLAGIDYFQMFINTVETYRKVKPNVSVHYAMQTNGTTLNDTWVAFLKEHHFLVGVSLDGYEENTNRFRIDIRGISQYQRIMTNIRKLQAAQVDINVLTVLTEILSKEPKRLYDFYIDNNIKYVQIIPCLPNLDLKEDLNALSPQSFASFYKAFYDQWLVDYKKGEWMSVGLFDNVILMYLGIAPQQCGMLGKCAPQFVVEGDGSVYPCDFFVLDEYRCGNVHDDSVYDLLRKSTMIRFLNESNNPSSSCKTCTFKSMCHGNCKRQNVVLFDDTGYCGYQEFLGYAQDSMIKVARGLRSNGKNHE